MNDHTELFEAALDSLPEGVAVLGSEGQVLFWNSAAEAILGHSRVDLLAREVPEALRPLLCGARNVNSASGETAQPGHGILIHARHKLGHNVQAIARAVVLRDGLGGHIGSAIFFHPAESLDALPHGETDDEIDVKASQAEIEDRLVAVFEDFTHGGLPFGVLWIAVDQARELRKTHGARACEAMMEKVERALAQGLRPAEQLGHWGEDELLVVSYERTTEMLAAHAQLLAGLARTADFRWWGDRVSLTVSIGAAQAEQSETSAQLLERAQEAMVSSIDGGGNHITTAPRRQACLPS
jgi:diguanylate cyclase (GGDEF)-like protein/PAS domain S-box-containing protein